MNHAHPIPDRPGRPLGAPAPPVPRAQSPDRVPVQLYTPAQAAEILTVRESWLRRRAGTRLIPCTFVGKHLRFSAKDITAIAEQGRRPARASTRRAATARRQ